MKHPELGPRLFLIALVLIGFSIWLHRYWDTLLVSRDQSLIYGNTFSGCETQECGVVITTGDDVHFKNNVFHENKVLRLFGKQSHGASETNAN